MKDLFSGGEGCITCTSAVLELAGSFEGVGPKHRAFALGATGRQAGAGRLAPARLRRAQLETRVAGGGVSWLGPPSSALSHPFCGEGSPTRIDYRNKLVPLF